VYFGFTMLFQSSFHHLQEWDVEIVDFYRSSFIWQQKEPLKNQGSLYRSSFQ